ncbi:MAG: hypothetical protein JWM10_3318, partial [Myxococcaceae bacterium]|nr:hypothetical protein [Myxococcaceae bacterium]
MGVTKRGRPRATLREPDERSEE